MTLAFLFLYTFVCFVCCFYTSLSFFQHFFSRARTESCFHVLCGDFCRWFRSPSVKWVSLFRFGWSLRIVFVLSRFHFVQLLVFCDSLNRWEKTRCSTMISLLLLFAFSNTLNIRFETFRMNTCFFLLISCCTTCFRLKSFLFGGLGYNLTLL